MRVVLGESVKRAGPGSLLSVSSEESAALDLANLTQSRVTWEGNLHETMSRWDWPVGLFVGDCLDYISGGGKTRSSWGDIISWAGIQDCENGGTER